MQAQDVKRLNEQFYEQVFKRRDVSAIDNLLTDDFVEHTPAPGQATTKQGAKDFIAQMLQAFPDLDYSIDSQIAEGDTVSAVTTMTGTHRGDFMGVPATGKKIKVQFLDTGRVRGNKFSEHWGLVDVPSMMSQLGVAPPMG
jgi:steroid delta-isomerase-like uncharacterized protein